MVIVWSRGDPINDEIGAICMFSRVVCMFEKLQHRATGGATRKEGLAWKGA